jgi:histidyl-tRNA synthetase
LKYKRITGTQDIFAPEIFLWQRVEREAKDYFEKFGYNEVRTPIIEEAELFVRSVGEFSEIVEKQFFSFKSHSGKKICLRPEVTASIVRAYIENSLFQKKGIKKFYYISPSFRAERPQKGRRRQFYQIGIEAIDSYEPIIDAEVLFILNGFLKEIGVKQFDIELNSLGCGKDKKNFIKILEDKLQNIISQFCENCQRRFKRNTLRILDCKEEKCQNLLKTIKIDLEQRLCSDCRTHFLELRNYLKSNKIDYIIKPFLVRGLDYYTRTVFEITTPNLGAQNAIAAGGRYDNLIEEMGGNATGAIGFAIGMERLLSLIKEEKQERTPLVFIAIQDERLKSEAFKSLISLRERGILTEIDYQNRSIKSQLRLANSLGVKYVIVFGEDEWKKGKVSLKDLDTGKQMVVSQKKIISEIIERN